MDLLDTVVRLTGARHARRLGAIQSLWGGHGEIVRVGLEGASVPSVVVKHVRPHARVHPRKVRSYAVEAAFYATHARGLPDGVRVAGCHGSAEAGPERVIVLEDLSHAGFSQPLRPLEPRRIEATLQWLAQLHAHFLGPPPAELWPVGTYWHLQTRLAELRATPGPRWSRRGPELDRQLRAATYQTVVHGDAKPANFLWSPASEAVAGVDFQYVGGGVGVRDVVYLLGVDGPDPWLDRYFTLLRAALPPSVDGAAVEAEWRALVPVAAEDFERFLAGWGRA